MSEPIWFALDDSRPLAFFAGIWTGWTCTRKVAEGEVTCELFAFLTTEPSQEVGAVHPKAMPVILTTPHEFETWLGAPWPEATACKGLYRTARCGSCARGEGGPASSPTAPACLTVTRARRTGTISSSAVGYGAWQTLHFRPISTTL